MLYTCIYLDIGYNLRDTYLFPKICVSVLIRKFDINIFLKARSRFFVHVKQTSLEFFYDEGNYSVQYPYIINYKYVLDFWKFSFTIYF